MSAKSIKNSEDPSRAREEAEIRSFEGTVEAHKPGHTQTGAPPKPGRSPNHHLTYTLVFFHV